MGFHRLYTVSSPTPQRTVHRRSKRETRRDRRGELTGRFLRKHWSTVSTSPHPLTVVGRDGDVSCFYVWVVDDSSSFTTEGNTTYYKSNTLVFFSFKQGFQRHTVFYIPGCIEILHIVILGIYNEYFSSILLPFSFSMSWNVKGYEKV